MRQEPAPAALVGLAPVGALRAEALPAAVLATVGVTGLAQLGVALAVGAALDTFVVRPVLIPALIVHIGRRVWPVLQLPVLPGFRLPSLSRGGA